MVPLELHPDALAEAEAAAARCAERDPRVAVKFAQELEATLGRIVEAPRRWPLHLHGTRRIPVLRFPFVVMYREEATRILAVAVANARRRPGY